MTTARGPWLTDIAVGGFVGLDLAGRVAALASLVYFANLANGMTEADAVFIAAAALMSAFLLWRGGIPNATGTVQDEPVAILVSGLTAGLAASNTPEEAGLATVFLALGLTSALTGAALWLVGRFGFADLIRVLPYPVMAGSLASSGYLMVSAITERVLGLSIGTSLMPEVAAHFSWTVTLLSVTFAAAMFTVQRMRWSLFAPVLFVGTTLAFYGWLCLFDIGLEEMRAIGVLADAGVLGPVDIQIPMPFAWGGPVSWPARIAMTPSIFAASIVGCFAYLLTLGGVELATRRDVDLNCELRLTGGANLLSATLGAPPSYLSASTTVLAEQLGARSRATAAAVLAILLLGLLLAETVLPLVPPFVLIGMILTIGANLLWSWCLTQARRLPILDWFIVVTIVAITAIHGILSAILAGFLISFVIFALRYGRISVFRRAGDARSIRSTVDRSPAEERLLARHAHAIETMILRGYLFFGSVEQVVSRVRLRLASAPAPRAIILDFSQVNGIAPPACSALQKMATLCAEKGSELVATHLPREIKAAIETSSIPIGAPGGLLIEASTDEVLEAYENAL